MSNLKILWREFVEEGAVTPGHFIPTEAPQLTADDVKDGEVLVELISISVDPYMRGRMRNTKGYFVGPFQPGEPLAGHVVARVVASKSASTPEGTCLSGYLPWQSFQVLSTEAVQSMQKIDASLDVPLSAYMGPMGMVGQTAYCSIAKIAKPQAGEVAFVSGAAGAVGYIAGQLLKNVYGCRVVGSAGSDEKVAFLKRIGFDDAWNYKTMSTQDALSKFCPQGVDIYFDNVGGETLEATLDHMKDFGRIVGCGSISQYDMPADKRYGVKNLFNIVTKSLLFQGFLVHYLMKDLGADFARDMPAFVKAGKVSIEQHVVAGIENAGQAFCDMMAGKNIGKMVVQVSKE